MTRRLAAIVFTDIVGFTALAQKDEKAALQLLQEQGSLVLPLLEAHRGRLVKSTGDGLLMEFPNAVDAVECGVDLQSHIHERNARPGSEPLRLRMAIHLGDIQDVGTDIFGDAINIAARIEAFADPGGVCLSEPVYVQVRNKVLFQLEKLGTRTLKDVQGPMDLYRVVLPWEHDEPSARPLLSRRLAAIMYTDVVGFTASAQANEADALARLREQEAIVRPLFEPYKGREIKSTGDGFLVEFESALGALECAVEIHRRMRERNSQKPRMPLELRIGLHVGDVEESGGDIFGDAVNVASRIVPLADPGGVCLSGQVFDQVRNKVPYQLDRLGPKSLKGVREPMDIYRIVLPWTGGDVTPGGSLLPRIAVLPLANISPDPKDEYFADGLTEELIMVLSQLKGLRVISRTSVNQYRGTTKSVAQIGAELGADSVLEGSVRKAGDQLRIVVQLIDTRTDEHRWAQTYDRKLENVFAIQAEVAERTASSLKVELLKSEREAIQEQPTSSLTAYEFYLRGIRAVQTGYGGITARTDREIAKYFEAAIREDPEFSAAYSQLANHLIVVAGETRPARIAFPRARKLVVKALELNPSSSEAHMARGNLAMQADLDWARAETEYQQAIALNPSNSAAHLWYAHLLSTLQRFREARKETLAATDLDPLWFFLRQALVWVDRLSGEYGRAVALGEKLIAEFSDHPYARSLLAWQYAQAGRTEDAVNLAAPLVGSPDMSARVQAVGLLAFLGNPQELRALVTEIESGRRTRPPNLGEIALMYSFCGEKEKALALLEQDSKSGDRLLWNHYQEPGFDPIRNDPRFIALLRAMKLPTTLSRPIWSGESPMSPGTVRSKRRLPSHQAPSH